MKRIFVLLVFLCCINIALAATVTTVENVPVKGKGFVALLSYDPAPAQPGKYVTLFIKVENRGEDVIEDARYKLIPEYPFMLKKGEDPIKYFGTIGAAQQVLLEYNLYVAKDAIEGTYPIKLRLCFDEACESGMDKELRITVRTGGEPKVEIGLEQTDIFHGGKRGEFTLFVVNRGDLDVTYLIVEVMPTEQFELISPGRVYIGEMESDDFETAEFEIYIPETVATKSTQRVRVPVYVEYTDENGKEYSETQSLWIKIYSKSDLIKMGLARDYDKFVRYVGSAFGLVILLIVIYNFYKRKFKA